MATIKDISKKSGVSVGTISKYLNGATLKEANATKIEIAIKELGYKRNTIARTMKTGKSMTIAVVIPKLANMFSMKIIESIEQEISPLGYNLFVVDCNYEKQSNQIQSLVSKMVDGIVLMPQDTNAEKIKELISDIPLVVIDRKLDENCFDSVLVNNREAVNIAITDLINNHNIKHIGIIEGPQNISTARERTQGFIDAISKFENVKFTRIKGEFTGGYLEMKELLLEDIDAVFTSNNETTVGALSAMEEMQDIRRLVGFDSIEFALVLKNRPYTFLTQPVENIGKTAAKLLLKRIEFPDKEIENIILECKLTQ